MNAPLQRRGMQIHRYRRVWVWLGLVYMLGWGAPGPLAPHNCRFWCITTDEAPISLLTNLFVNQPHSMINLSPTNPDGWSIAWYPVGQDEPLIHRGQQSAHLDGRFDQAVDAVVQASTSTVVSHVRQCSSGLCNIPNPHPFARTLHDTQWLMGHNGFVSETLILSLLDEDFLATHPPEHGINAETWIDSELLFLLLLQSIQDKQWDVKAGLAAAIEHLHQLLPANGRYLNFFLTDGQTIWAYREGQTLYYIHESGPAAYTAVASQYPDQGQGAWLALADRELITLTADAPPLVEDIADYFQLVSVPDVQSNGSIVRHGNYPNPFNPQTYIDFTLNTATPVSIGIYDLSGRRIRTLLADQVQAAGSHSVVWDGRDARGRGLGSGVYIYRIVAGSDITAGRMSLVR